MCFGGIWSYRQNYRQIAERSCYRLSTYEAIKNPLSNEEGGF
jgi:hypothetical protein